MHIQQTPLQNPKKTIFQFTSNTLEIQGQKVQQVTIDDLPSEYYSSDEQDSDWGNNLN